MSQGNPSRLQRRQKFFRRLRLYGYASGGVLAAVLFFYLFAGSPLFKVGALKVVGGESIDQSALISLLKSQVAATSLGWLGADNYLAWPTTLDYTAPLVSSIAIEKSFWSRAVAITVIPRQRYAVWCGEAAAASDACYWVDETGVLFETAPVAEGQLVQTIFDTAPTLGSLGSSVLETSTFQKVKKIIDGAKKLDMSIAKITVNRRLEEVWLDTAGGTRIIFSSRFDPEPTALPALSRFIKKPGLSGLAYVNLTVENRAFTKAK